MSRNTNQRIMLTKKMLKNSLVVLLKEKDIYHISVRELCEHAGINRSTFYKYYGSPFDLLSDMENDLISVVISSLSEEKTAKHDILEMMLSYIDNNLELSRLLINNNVNPYFAEKIITLPQLQEKADQILKTRYEACDVEYISNFLIYGAYQIVKIWANKEDRETPGEISALILEQIEKVIN